MQIRRVEIKRFRGIKELTWNVNGPINCLIGPGDSTKSTVLSAIEYTLSSRWRIDINDSDFHNGNTDEPIVIVVTVGALPDGFKSDNKFGLYLRGWDGTTLHDEPEQADELVMSVQLMVDKSLEPKWSVINDRQMEGRTISASDRDTFGIVRIGDYLDRHLTWTTGSALARLTEKGDDLTLLLASIARLARSSIPSTNLPKFQSAATEVTTISKAMGVRPRESFQPHLDIKSVDVSAGALSLHDGDIPVRLAGMGTRRLITFAIQQKAVANGAIALIDEVETGLEPHRLRRLIRNLRKEFSAQGASSAGRGQLFATTHSPTVVDELPCTELRIVRNRGGNINIEQVDENAQKTVRRAPEVFLSNNIVVCEGVTEIGLCRALDIWWLEHDAYDPLALKGVSLADGNGKNSEQFVLAMAKIGYSVAFFGDSDRVLNPTQATLESAGATVILWGGNLCLEQRAMDDLPWAGVQELLLIAINQWRTEDKIRAATCGTLSLDKATLRPPISEWKDTPELRRALGLAAKGGAWFKDADLGEQFGQVVTKHLPSIPTTNLATTIVKLRTWIDSHG